MPAVAQREGRQIDSTVSESTMVRMDVLTGSAVKHLRQQPMIVLSGGRRYLVSVDDDGRTIVRQVDNQPQR